MLLIIVMVMIVPIEVILVGRVTDVSPVHDWKAQSPNGKFILIIMTRNNDDDSTDRGNTSRNSNRCQSCTCPEGINA